VALSGGTDRGVRAASLPSVSHFATPKCSRQWPVSAHRSVCDRVWKAHKVKLLHLVLTTCTTSVRCNNWRCSDRRAFIFGSILAGQQRFGNAWHSVVSLAVMPFHIADISLQSLPTFVVKSRWVYPPPILCTLTGTQHASICGILCCVQWTPHDFRLGCE
jgi:hypothetical protein